MIFKKSKTLSIAAVLILMIAGFGAYVTMQPAEYSVSRAVKIAAAPAAIYPQLNNLALWNSWSPWARLDPDAQITFGDTIEGVGASMTWHGNSAVGEGTLMITHTEPDRVVRYSLEFRRPMQDTAMAEFIMTPEAGETTVTWRMYGQNDSFLKKAMWVALCQHMIGGQFDNGLQNLKAAVETPPPAMPAGTGDPALPDDPAAGAAPEDEPTAEFPLGE